MGTAERRRPSTVYQKSETDKPDGLVGSGLFQSSGWMASMAEVA